VELALDPPRAYQQDPISAPDGSVCALDGNRPRLVFRLLEYDGTRTRRCSTLYENDGTVTARINSHN
jgi:hypothetical protein